MVANYCSDFHRVVGLRDAAEQILQAVTFLGHQDDSALRDSVVGDLPADLGAPITHELSELLAQLVYSQVERVGADRLASEKPSGLRVGEEVRLGDPRTNVGQESRQGGNDTGTVWTAEREDVLALGWSTAICGDERASHSRYLTC